ncbi:hypothetical protein N7540_013070 [Penicillium herquei]|nr:hypothetical protein N7540_013070 [Penicillium herquei]
MSSDDHPAKRQCLPAQESPKDTNMADSKENASSIATGPDVVTACSGPLGSEIRDFLDNTRDQTNSALKLLQCYLDMWEFYVIRSAEMIRLKEEHQQLQESNDCLIGECDTLLQCSKEQGLVLQDRRQAVRALQNGVISALHASEPQPFPIYGPEQDPEMAHNSDGNIIQVVQT